MTKDNSIQDFEQNLEALENLVDTLEAGDLSLEDALSHFEQGIKKTRACQKALNEAEQRVKVLIESKDGISLENFEHENERA